MSEAVSIREAEPVDVDVLVALHAASFEAAWPRHVIAPSLGMPGSFACLALIGDRPAGFFLARVHAGEGEIMTLCVVPEARGLGIGRVLVRALLERSRARGASEIFLEVATDNDAARALYRRFGFAEVGGRRGYYQRTNGKVDALVLRAALSPV